jgi:hypothetical protein
VVNTYDKPAKIVQGKKFKVESHKEEDDYGVERVTATMKTPVTPADVEGSMDDQQEEPRRGGKKQRGPRGDYRPRNEGD